MDPKIWKSLFDYNSQLLKGADDTLFRLLRELWRPTLPEAELVLTAVKQRDVQKLLDWAGGLAAQSFSSASLHYEAHQYAALFRKYPFPPHLYKVDGDQVAYDRLLLTEARGAEVNARFAGYWRVSPHEYDLDRMRNFVAYVLGQEPNLESIYSKCNFGPGTNIGVHGDATNYLRKILSEEWTVTAGCYNHARLAMGRSVVLRELLYRREGHYQRFYCVDPYIAREEYERRVRIVDHNKIAFVPKDATTSRLIGIEALLNGYVQKGIDLEMRDHLLRVGFDLTDQSRNSHYARFGSEDDGSEEGFITVDLKDASNCVFRGPVEYIFPRAWVDLFNQVRSPAGVSTRGTLRYEFLASMGNGFCFPLETLLIASACHAAGCGAPRKDYVVYGDDVVIRRRHFPRVRALLELLGFQINEKKTFTVGPFRESCGADWFKGENVRPYILDAPLEKIEAVFCLLNHKDKHALSSAFFEDVNLDWFDVPRKLRFVRPHEGPPDSAVTVPRDEFLSSPYARWNTSQQRWSWVELRHMPVADRGSKAMESKDLALMYAALSGGSSDMPFAFRRKSRMKLARV